MVLFYKTDVHHAAFFGRFAVSDRNIGSVNIDHLDRLLAFHQAVRGRPAVDRSLINLTGMHLDKMWSIRLEAMKIDEMDSVWQILKQRVHDYLAAQELTNVLIERDDRLPTRDPRSSKFHHVSAELPQSRPMPES
ncbi:MAG TPA: hypothetical protein VK206_15780 [Anaerolineales bacterium]|nr:hypothetical protein [Anaerolineales bacterium]